VVETDVCFELCWIQGVQLHLTLKNWTCDMSIAYIKGGQLSPSGGAAVLQLQTPIELIGMLVFLEC